MSTKKKGYINSSLHGLMYTTGFMLMVFGVPASPIAVTVLYFKGSLTLKATILASIWLSGIALIIGATLFLIANYITYKHRKAVT
jgi:hypothetical protein